MIITGTDDCYSDSIVAVVPNVLSSAAAHFTAAVCVFLTIRKSGRRKGTNEQH